MYLLRSGLWHLALLTKEVILLKQTEKYKIDLLSSKLLTQGREDTRRTGTDTCRRGSQARSSRRSSHPRPDRVRRSHTGWQDTWTAPGHSLDP